MQQPFSSRPLLLLSYVKDKLLGLRAKPFPLRPLLGRGMSFGFSRSATWRKTHVLPAVLSNIGFAVLSHGRQVNVEILLPSMQGICEFMLTAQQDPDPEVRVMIYLCVC